MIDRIEQILLEINKELDVKDSYTYKGIFLSRDEWRFIQKCLSQYQSILITEANRDNTPKKGECDD